MKKKKSMNRNNHKRMIEAFDLMNNSLELLKKGLNLYNNMIQKDILKKCNTSSQKISSNKDYIDKKLYSLEEINSGIVDANLLNLIEE